MNTSRDGRVEQQAALPLTRADFTVASLTDSSDSAAVRRVLGSPDHVVPPMRSPRIQVSYLDWYYRDIGVSMGPHDARVREITLSTSRYATARGLKVGEPISRIRELYGTALDTGDGAWTYYDPATITGKRHVIQIGVQGGTVQQIYFGWQFD